MDPLQLILIVNVIALVVVIVTAGVLAYTNSGSKTLPLMAAALIGVLVGYGIQLPFELSKSTTHETIGTELTIDRSKPVIRQWIYSSNVAWRISVEVGASDWLAKNNPGAFEQAEQRDKLTSDLVMFSLLSFLTHQEFDWQIQRSSYSGKTSGRMELAQSVSKPNECTAYTETDLRQRLKSSGNLFANAPLRVLGGQLCLPPQTALELSADTLTLRNRLCQISFNVQQPAHNILYVDPKSREVVLLPNGESRYEIRNMGINVETVFFGLRAQHRDRGKYQVWASRVINGTRQWFEDQQ